MELIKHNIDKIKIIAFLLMVSFFILLLTSKCSFIYPFNDWVDANAFFTVGKAMFNGVVPYKDLFEQKGILLYLIYGFGYLISNKSFIGIFILEVFFWTVALYYIHKTISLFLPKYYSYIIIPIFMTILCTSISFVHGGGAEEFCMPFLAISLYHFLMHFKEKEISYKNLFLNGFIAGCILLIKYTLLGFWFGFMAFIFFDLFFSKKYKKAFISCCIFLLGMFIPFGLSLIYFTLNNGIKEFFNVYFIFNMTIYNNDSNILMRLFLAYSGFIERIWKNGLFEILLLLFMPAFLVKLKLNKKGKIALLFLYLITILGIFWGLRFYRYYTFPLIIFIIISLVVIFDFIDKYLHLTGKKIVIFSLMLSIFGSIVFANYREMRFTPKKDMFQYEFLEIIDKASEHTLVNMGGLDSGLYTTTGIVPTTYFFELQNINYDRFPDNLDSFKKYILEKKTKFIIYTTSKKIDTLKEKEKELFENYELIIDRKYMNEKKWHYAYLFERKELKNE